MTPALAYRNQTALGWTRIDMLLALYDAGIEAAQRGHEAQVAADRAALIAQRLRLQAVLVQLLAGLNPGQGQVPQNVQRLVLFMLDRLSRGGSRDWQVIAHLLGELRDGFSAIYNEAVELEQRGEIPPLGAGLAFHAIA